VGGSGRVDHHCQVAFRKSCIGRAVSRIKIEGTPVTGKRPVKIGWRVLVPVEATSRKASYAPGLWEVLLNGRVPNELPVRDLPGRGIRLLG